MESIKLTASQKQRLIKKLDDLEIQSMMFDMDIDIETLSLVEKRSYKQPEWLRKWRDRLDASDTRLFDSEH